MCSGELFGALLKARLMRGKSWVVTKARPFNSFPESYNKPTLTSVSISSDRSGNLCNNCCARASEELI